MKTRTIFKYFSFLIILLSFNAHAESAKNLYDSKNFHGALELLLKNETKTAKDYYNIGNVYFRMGKLGQALGYFEKAYSLAPGKEDIAYNLNLTEKALLDSGQLSKNRSIWYGRIVPFSKKISWLWIELLVAGAAILFGLRALKAKRSGLKARDCFVQPEFIGLFTLLVISTIIGTSFYFAKSTKLAAVISEKSVARSGPGDSFKELSKLNPGSKVVLTRKTQNGWRQVRFSLGNVGWIMEKDYLSL